MDVRQRINIKYFMVGYLGLLLLGASIISGHPERILYGLVIVALYAGFDLLWTRLRDKAWYVPVSSWISGLVLANVAIPVLSLPVLLLLPFVAVFSKQALHFGKARHIFNPAAFSLMILTCITPVIAWWSASANGWMTLFAAIAGAFILWRQQRSHIFISFSLAYALGLSVFAFAQGLDVQALRFVLRSAFLNGAVIFFATVMLIEPITSGFPAVKQRAIYGALVGVFATLGLFIPMFVPVLGLDPLIIGLLLGDLTAGLFFLPAAPRTVSA